MRILGIDPGLQTTGFGVLDVEGHKLRYVASGTIRTHKMALGDLPGRLKVLFDGIGEVAARYQPDVATVEIVFVNVNPQSTLLLGQARGACITALVARDLPVAEYTALQMKKAVVGHGRAAKSQVQEMVRRLLSLPGLPGQDAADALGLAITHAHAGAAMALRATVLAFPAGAVLWVLPLLARLTAGRYLQLGPRYLLCGDSIVYYGNVRRLVLSRSSGTLELFGADGPVLRLERDKFPTNARKPDKITRNKATKFEKVSARIIERVLQAAPGTPLEDV